MGWLHLERHTPNPRQLQKTVLVADDEKLVLKLIARFLTRSGFNVLAVRSGEDALRQSRNYTGRIHLLLAGIEMPDMTGIELAGKITLERPEIKVMIMSGFCRRMLMLALSGIRRTQS